MTTPEVYVNLGLRQAQEKCCALQHINNHISYMSCGRHGRDRRVVGFTTTCAISAYHH